MPSIPCLGVCENCHLLSIKNFRTTNQYLYCNACVKHVNNKKEDAAGRMRLLKIRRDARIKDPLMTESQVLSAFLSMGDRFDVQLTVVGRDLEELTVDVAVRKLDSTFYIMENSTENPFTTHSKILAQVPQESGAIQEGSAVDKIVVRIKYHPPMMPYIKVDSHGVDEEELQRVQKRPLEATLPESTACVGAEECRDPQCKADHTDGRFMAMVEMLGTTTPWTAVIDRLKVKAEPGDDEEKKKLTDFASARAKVESMVPEMKSKYPDLYGDDEADIVDIEEVEEEEEEGEENDEEEEVWEDN